MKLLTNVNKQKEKFTTDLALVPSQRARGCHVVAAAADDFVFARPQAGVQVLSLQNPPPAISHGTASLL